MWIEVTPEIAAAVTKYRHAKAAVDECRLKDDDPWFDEIDVVEHAKDVARAVSMAYREDDDEIVSYDWLKSIARRGSIVAQQPRLLEALLKTGHAELLIHNHS